MVREVLPSYIYKPVPPNAGPLKKAEIFYKQDGTSTGTAGVLYPYTPHPT